MGWKKELLERKIGGKKSKISAALAISQLLDDRPQCLIDDTHLPRATIGLQHQA